MVTINNLAHWASSLIMNLKLIAFFLDDFYLKKWTEQSKWIISPPHVQYLPSLSHHGWWYGDVGLHTGR